MRILFVTSQCMIYYFAFFFLFQPMHTSILHLKGEHSVRSEGRSTRYSYCYVTWWPLTTEIVALTMPVAKGCGARDALPETWVFLRSGCLNAVKAILTQWNKFTINLRTSLKAILLIWAQWAKESHWNGASAWHSWHGVRRTPLHTRLLDAEDM